MVDLGVHKSLTLSEVFSGEAVEFTPWLASNLKSLADHLGFELETDEVEVAVGSFKADIKAKTSDGRTVVIENQFNSTDHNHLGQILTYAAGLDADILIWVSEKIRDEHRAAIDWLNDKAIDAEFFAIEARMVSIDSSRPALFWDVIASPNDWSRLTRSVLADGNAYSDMDKVKIEYWTSLRQRIEEKGAHITAYKPSKENWQGGSIGTSAIWLNSSISLRDKWQKLEIYIGRSNAGWWFEQLKSRREAIEDELGYEINWDPAHNRKGCRVGIWRPCDPEDVEDWPSQHDWFIEKRVEWERVFRKHINEIKNIESEISSQ